jgi:hypothetical protein
MSEDTARARCQRQLLTRRYERSALDVVEWFGAIQAQDYGAALWAIGQRSAGLTAQDIEAAINGRQIVRTWPLRGTIHFVAAADLRWMLALTGARQLEKSQSVLRNMGLDADLLNRGRVILERVLQDRPLTRPEIYAAFDRSDLGAKKGAGLHILGYWAQAGVICLGAHRGKQPTFALLDDWLAGTRPRRPDREEALATLANRYFQSHAPATERDFAWWSGLSLTAAREAIRLAGDRLEERKDKAGFVWHPASDPPDPTAPDPLVRLLSPFDELLVAYKDRSAYHRDSGPVDPSLTFFGPTILLNGRLVGRWKKTVAAKSARLSLQIAPGAGRVDRDMITAECARLSRFWGQDFTLEA